MKEYCLTFKALSTISKLPSAQTIFGAICHILLYTQGEKAFKEYINSFDKKPLLIHSSMFPMNMLPMISQNLFTIEYINKNILKEKPENQLAYLAKMKQLKKIRYVDEKVYDKYLLPRKFEELQDDIISNKNIKIENQCLCFKEMDVSYNLFQQMNTHVRKKDYYVGKSDDNSLYYDESFYCGQDDCFCVFVKSNQSIDKIENIFKYSHMFGFGARHSVGKNSFELIDIREIKHNCNKEYRLLLSQSILDYSFVLNDSHYQIDSKQYRPSSQYLNKVTHHMNLFKEGSYMRVKDDKEWYGSLLSIGREDKPLYYYAIGYAI